MLAKLGAAMKDVAETLRRVYRDPPAREVALRFTAHPRPPFAALDSCVRSGLDPFAPRLGGQRLQPEASLQVEPVALDAKLQGEGAWATWSTGARVAVMAVFESRGTGRLEVPALPRRPAVGTIQAERFPSRVRPGFDALPSPRSREAGTSLAAPAPRRDLDLALSLPVAIMGEDLRAASKPVQMRCSLQIVKATGENVRNLDLLGRYLIPKKGVKELRHDAASGRLRVLLGPEAAGSGRVLLLLARRKDDHGLITCLAEDP